MTLPESGFLTLEDLRAKFPLNPEPVAITISDFYAGGARVPAGSKRNFPSDIDGKGVNADIPSSGELRLMDFYGAPYIVSGGARKYYMQYDNVNRDRLTFMRASNRDIQRVYLNEYIRIKFIIDDLSTDNALGVFISISNRTCNLSIRKDTGLLYASSSIRGALGVEVDGVVYKHGQYAFEEGKEYDVKLVVVGSEATYWSVRQLFSGSNSSTSQWIGKFWDIEFVTPTEGNRFYAIDDEGYLLKDSLCQTREIGLVHRNNGNGGYIKIPPIKMGFGERTSNYIEGWATYDVANSNGVNYIVCTSENDNTMGFGFDGDDFIVSSTEHRVIINGYDDLGGTNSNNYKVPQHILDGHPFHWKFYFNTYDAFKHETISVIGRGHSADTSYSGRIWDIRVQGSVETGEFHSNGEPKVERDDLRYYPLNDGLNPWNRVTDELNPTRYNFQGSNKGHVIVPEWKPSGKNWSVEFRCIIDSTKTDQVLVSGEAGAGTDSIYINWNNGTMSMYQNGVQTILHTGVPSGQEIKVFVRFFEDKTFAYYEKRASSDKRTLKFNHDYTAPDSIKTGIDKIGYTKWNNGELRGEYWDFKFRDYDNPTNRRWYQLNNGDGASGVAIDSWNATDSSTDGAFGDYLEDNWVDYGGLNDGLLVNVTPDQWELTKEGSTDMMIMEHTPSSWTE